MAHVHINKLALLATLLVAVAAAFCVVGVASVSENWALIQAKSKDLHTTADLAKLGTLKFKTFHYSPLNIDSQTYTYEKSEISEIQDSGNIYDGGYAAFICSIIALGLGVVSFLLGFLLSLGKGFARLGAFLFLLCALAAISCALAVILFAVVGKPQEFDFKLSNVVEVKVKYEVAFILVCCAGGLYLVAAISYICSEGRRGYQTID